MSDKALAWETARKIADLQCAPTTVVATDEWVEIILAAFAKRDQFRRKNRQTVAAGVCRRRKVK